MKLTDATVFLTGGAMGFGAGLTEALIKSGAKVFIGDVNEEQGKILETRLRSTYGEDKATFVKCDVTKPQELTDAFNSAVSAAGHIDIMLNNAGMIHENKWNYMMDVNLGGVVIGTNLAVEHMRKDKGGKGGIIINTGSFAGLDPRFVFPVYAASKAAVVHFTSCWAANPYLGEMGIRFASMNPTAVNTGFINNQKPEQLLYYKEFQEMLKSLSLLPIDTVVGAFLKVIEDDESNGTIMTISLKNGVCPMKMNVVKV
ncbi:hypothetical protein SNE40_011799 [Patella caerulea]|uniref:15-hydroxyprostaglandin dehydrogenase [NAD(+)] n=1 Tax=Patella caerulea TaxID=87958 RepID=A0AAN8JP29_PATCE